MKSIPAKFPAQKIAAAAAVLAAVWVYEHATFCAKPIQALHESAQVASAFKSDGFNGVGIGTAAHGFCSGDLTLIPVASNVWQVESGEPDGMAVVAFIKPVPTVAHCGHGHFVSGIIVSKSSPTAGVDFSVNANLWKSLCEPSRGINDVAVAGPENFSVPLNAATVELLGSEPSKQRLSAPVFGQQHGSFVNHSGWLFGFARPAAELSVAPAGCCTSGGLTSCQFPHHIADGLLVHADNLTKPLGFVNL